MQTRTSQGQNFQDSVLANLRDRRSAATLYLNNRMALHGRILDFDPYVLLLEPTDGSPIQMVYKSSVVSVAGPPMRGGRRPGPPGQRGGPYDRPRDDRPRRDDYRGGGGYRSDGPPRGPGGPDSRGPRPDFRGGGGYQGGPDRRGGPYERRPRPDGPDVPGNGPGGFSARPGPAEPQQPEPPAIDRPPSEDQSS
jgi:RNA chaperone Hfq